MCTQTHKVLIAATLLLLIPLGSFAEDKLVLPCLTLNNNVVARVDVLVSREVSAQSYIYAYSIYPRQGKLIGFDLDDIGTSMLSSSFSGWDRCSADNMVLCAGPMSATGHSYTGLQIQSSGLPGIVRYSLISTYNVNEVNASFQRIQDFFGGDRQVAADAMSDAVERDCPYDQRSNDFDRGRTGVTIGPALHRLLPLRLGPRLSASGASALSTQFSSGPSLSPLRSVDLFDSRMRPIRGGTAEIPGGVGASASAWVDLDPGALECDIDGIVVKGFTIEGEEVWGGIQLKSSACPPSHPQFTITKPKSVSD